MKLKIKGHSLVRIGTFITIKCVFSVVLYNLFPLLNDLLQTMPHVSVGPRSIVKTQTVRRFKPPHTVFKPLPLSLLDAVLDS